MKTSIWYHTADRQPSKTGHYLAYRSYSMGDDSTDTGYYYYNTSTKGWTDGSSSYAHYANVYYWTDADPDAWVDADPPVTQRKKKKQEVHPALQEAWQNVQEAIERYEVLKALIDEYKS